MGIPEAPKPAGEGTTTVEKGHLLPMASPSRATHMNAQECKHDVYKTPLSCRVTNPKLAPCAAVKTKPKVLSEP